MTLNFLCDVFANQDAYDYFWSSHEEWNQNRVLAIELTILEHVLFRRNLEVLISDCYNSGNKSKKHTNIPALLADTIRALCIAETTLSTHL